MSNPSKQNTVKKDESKKFDWQREVDFHWLYPNQDWQLNTQQTLSFAKSSPSHSAKPTSQHEQAVRREWEHDTYESAPRTSQGHENPSNPESDASPMMQRWLGEGDR